MPTIPLCLTKPSTPGEHDPIVDPKIFQAVQDLLAEQRRSGGSERKTRHNALLKGLISCDHCGCGMTYTWTKKQIGKRAKARARAKNKTERVFGYYSCQKARERGAERCPMPSLPSGTVEEMVVKEIAAICGNPALADKLISRSCSSKGSPTTSARSLEAEAERDVLVERARSTAHRSRGTRSSRPK